MLSKIRDVLLAVPLFLFLLARLIAAWLHVHQKSVCEMSLRTPWEFHRPEDNESWELIDGIHYTKLKDGLRRCWHCGRPIRKKD